MTFRQRLTCSLLSVKFFNLKFHFSKQAQQLSTHEDSHAEEVDNDHPEMSKVEVEMAKQNFDFYAKSKGGAIIELFELPMILTACGYNVSTPHILQLQEFLATRKSAKIDFAGLQAVLT